MKKNLKRISILFLSVVFFLNTSCLGSFSLTNKLLNFNKKMTGNKFVNALVFFIAYGIYVVSFTFIDGIILNSLEFWTGSNPLALNDGDVIERSVFHKNQEYYVRATKNKVEITPKGGETFVLNYNDEENVWYAEFDNQSLKLDDENMRLLQKQAVVAMQ